MYANVEKFFEGEMLLFKDYLLTIDEIHSAISILDKNKNILIAIRENRIKHF